jgi:chromosome segregation protein
VELKRLEVFGFKSFADRTRFDFDSGVTVIVGPNGCGKSNVVDAVKWVLGEQSPRSLRGREMADIIFAGSESRRSLGFAEATLVFDNARGLLPIDAAEVEVSRRLYRSGESEYLLNRKPCRLRDVRELFMDTGVGVDAYSLIEQGKVDVLLQSNPQERRVIFEEAAGISKYKAKRREAERKLQRTEQNLLRLGDILEEVERRLRSVKYQAGKARNYVEYSQRLKDLRLSYALSQYHEQMTALGAHQAALDGLQAERSARAATLARLDQERSRLEGEVMDLARQARDADARLGQARSGIAMCDSEIGFHRTRVGELGQIIERDRRKIADLSAHLQEAEAAVQARRSDTVAVAEAAARQQEAVAAVEARLQAVSEQARSLAVQVDAAKAALMEFAHQKSQRGNRLAGLELRIETLQAQAAKLRARQEEIAVGLRQLEGRQAELAAEVRKLEDAITERRGHLEAKRHEAETKQKEVEDLGQQLARAKEKASALDSRRELLQDLEARGEGIPAAVRRVTEAIAAGGAADRWRGMVADLIEVDVAHALVIESALGPAEKLLIADRQEDILALARSLQGQLPGQVRFLAADALAPASNGHDLSACPEALGWAMDYVRADEAMRPAIAHLLARTVVVRTLEDAIGLARGPLAGYRFVTTTGDVLEADGSVAIGPPGPETSLISRRSELRGIALEREDVGRCIEDLSDRRGRAMEELRALDIDQQQLRQEIYEGSMAKVEMEGTLRRLGETQQAFLAEAPLVESEQADLARQMTETAAQREAVRLEVEALARREAEQLAVIAARVGEQEVVGRQRTVTEEERTQARIALAQFREKQAALAGQVAAAERDLAGTVEGIAQARADLDQSRDRIHESERAMLRLQSEMAQLFLEKETAETEIRRLAGLRDDRQAAIAALSDQARDVEAESDAFQEEMHRRELERREIQTKRDDLVQRIRDDFSVDLAERYVGWQTSDVDWNAVSQEIHELQGKIERLGAVNLEAIQEQDALEERAALLRQQKDDLVKAREALGGLIERINRESRERFLKTFTSVREHFQELYRKLFGGGKADVFLEDEADVLESGIEVVARPPGKQLQRISLLSGGEKTMTAVALLLAIFRARPSPFCILDEVDAALDEANVDRFTSVVREFLDQSQFVIISHNKRTMAIANVLYGVTMQEPGVSRKVSVKFSDLHEQDFAAGDQTESPEEEAEADGAEVAAALEPAADLSAAASAEAEAAGPTDPADADLSAEAYLAGGHPAGDASAAAPVEPADPAAAPETVEAAQAASGNEPRN